MAAIDVEGELAMTLATTFLAAALAVPSMPPPEYDDCEVVTNYVFDASRRDAKVFSVQIELDATPSNVFVGDSPIRICKWPVRWTTSRLSFDLGDGKGGAARYACRTCSWTI